MADTDTGGTGQPLELYKCKLTLLAPMDKSKLLKKIIAPLTGWMDPSFQIVAVEERVEEFEAPKQKMKIQGRLVTPSFCVMLFVRETGVMSVKDCQQHFKKPPWSFHHKVELQCKSSPEWYVGKQEFYKIADDQPLWAVCPIHYGNEHLRINIYVHKFNEMVEFYRAITDVEIESNKPNFCIFQLYQQPGMDIQLSLKYSPLLHPVSVASAYMSFNVPNIETVKAGITSEILRVKGNLCMTNDPDGNLVVLYETSGNHSETEGPGCSHWLSSLDTLPEDVKSMKSSSDSHDSGRCSDLDGTCSEFEMVSLGQHGPSILPKKDPTQNKSAKGKTPVGNGAIGQKGGKGKKKTDVGGPASVSNSHETGINSNVQKTAGPGKTPHGQIAPVYI